MSKKNIWYTRCPVPTAFSIALRNGWFDEEFAADGIEVSSLLKSSDRVVRESHFDHTLPDSFRHGGNAPPIWARAKGNDVRLIGLSWTDQPQFLRAYPRAASNAPPISRASAWRSRAARATASTSGARTTSSSTRPRSPRRACRSRTSSSSTSSSIAASSTNPARRRRTVRSGTRRSSGAASARRSRRSCGARST